MLHLFTDGKHTNEKIATFLAQQRPPRQLDINEDMEIPEDQNGLQELITEVATLINNPSRQVKAQAKKVYNNLASIYNERAGFKALLKIQ